MTRARRRFRESRLREEAGFTLIEMMMTAVLLSVILGAVTAVLNQTAKSAARDTERNHAINELRVGLTRMTTELRQAYKIHGCGTATPETCTMTDYARTIDFSIRARDKVPRRVIYDCTAPFDGTTNLPRGSQTTAGTADQLYRTCVRKASTVLTSPPTTITNRLVQRVVNWCRASGVTCPAGGSATTTPAPPAIFTYRSAELTGAAGGIAVELNTPSGTATASGRDPRLATSVHIALEAPSGGERRRGIGGTILLQDGGYLRNIDLQ